MKYKSLSLTIVLIALLPGTIISQEQDKSKSVWGSIFNGV
jgi:hypothetical protein